MQRPLPRSPGALRENFERGLEVGASFAAVHVVDLLAGDRDAHGTPWEEDTLVNAYSATKVVAALTTLMLVDRGELDLDVRLAFAYVMNKMGATTLGDRRAFGPARAAFEAIQSGA